MITILAFRKLRAIARTLQAKLKFFDMRLIGELY